MKTIDSKQHTLNLIEKIQDELKSIEFTCLDSVAKEKINKLLAYIEGETTNNKSLLVEKLLYKIKLTRKIDPELNTSFYILYRNLLNDKISVQDAQDIYEMYVREL